MRQRWRMTQEMEIKMEIMREIKMEEIETLL
jgi:hypothetical protein